LRLQERSLAELGMTARAVSGIRSFGFYFGISTLVRKSIE
jgi:hypothetical protein